METNGILKAYYQPNVIIDGEIALHILETRKKFVGLEKPVPVMLYNLGVIEMDREAQEILAGPQGVEGICASAFLINSSTTIIMSFILKIKRPPIPVKGFFKESEALKWLEKYL